MTVPPAVLERLLTARELAEYLGLSTATVLDWFEAGRLPGFRLGGRKGGPVRFRLSEGGGRARGLAREWVGGGRRSVTHPYRQTDPRRSV